MIASGILNTSAGLFVDIFLLVLLFILNLTLVGVAFVRRGKVRAHVVTMVSAFILFVVAVGAFEVDVWTGGERPSLPRVPLTIHLCFAFPCLFVWVRQIWTWRRAFDNPGPHRRRGRALLLLLSLTVATGFWLYYATFVASS